MTIVRWRFAGMQCASFLTSSNPRQAVLNTCGSSHAINASPYARQTLFMERVISRTHEWQCRFPALSASSQLAHSMSQGRQIVAAATDANGVRCVFFSNHGSVLDFTATWGELERAKTWWYFVRRWNFWVVSSEAELHALRTNDEATIYGVALDAARVEHCQRQTVLALLDRIEQRARSFIDVIAAEPIPTAAIQTCSPTAEAM